MFGHSDIPQYSYFLQYSRITGREDRYLVIGRLQLIIIIYNFYYIFNLTIKCNTNFQ
ncbi:hypothetical protein LEQ41_06405 [Streptococcus agalactiae]|nr:hypothetical protein [Streptococcus agalactiae]